MAINLTQLEQAAERYHEHCDATKNVDPKTFYQEKSDAARRHLELFVPPSEKLLTLRATGPSDVADAARGLLTLEGDRVPEIIQRDNDLRPVRFLHLAALVARSVGRIRINDGPATQEGDATGFLIAPGLLMTNWHVLKAPEFAAAASVIFDDEELLNGDLKENKIFRLLPDSLFVADQSLDYAIVAVSPRTTSGVPLSQFGYLRLFEQTGKIDPNQKSAANIIQHPGGGSKKIAFRDNYIDEVVPNKVDPDKRLSSIFYGTDTLKGSSGAPVCSDQWFVVALHRGGVAKTEMIEGKSVVMRRDGQPARQGDSPDQIKYVANEGTRISRIYFSLRQKSAAEAPAREALERIKAVAQHPQSGPVDLRTAPLSLPSLPTEQLGGPEEITRRSVDKFKNATGYRPAFLGTRFRVPLPRLTSEVQRELAPLKNSTATELKYDHYSLKMNHERRTAVFVACNIDGALLWNNHNLGKRPDRPPWSFDPRMSEQFQPDDIIFSNAMQRGHLFKREDAGWGADKDAINRADQHSFTITNATPMIANFNNVEWGDLEDLVTRECEQGRKVSYFAGPIFRSTDRFFNELRRNVPVAQRRQGMRVPESFWKIVVWVERGGLRSAGFILDQTDEIAAAGPMPEEINFGTYRQKRITEIEQATGLRFPELVRTDTFSP